MTRRFHPLKRLLAERSGVAALEFSITAPILIVMTVGILQLGLAFFASAGLRNGVEAGARYGQIYPLPSDSDVRSKVLSSSYGMDLSQPYTLSVTRGVANGENYTDVTMAYPFRFNFLLFQTPAMQFTYTRRAYRP